MADQRLTSPNALFSLNVEGNINNTMLSAVVAAWGSVAWPATSRIMYIPVACPGYFRITQFACVNGSAVSGNVDMGIYTREGARIVSTGSTAQAGTNATQLIDVTDTEIPPGWYYLAMVIDNTTGTNFRTPSTTPAKRTFGCQEQASTFPLPASASFSAASDAYWPAFKAMGVAT